MPGAFIALAAADGRCRAVAVEVFHGARHLVGALTEVWEHTYTGDTHRLVSAVFGHTSWDAIDATAAPNRLPPIGGGIAVPGVGYATAAAFGPAALTTATVDELLRLRRAIVQIRPAADLLAVHHRGVPVETYRLGDGPPRPCTHRL
ncbi:hypothetical protein [Actinocatenispora rupis]|uniref:Uncharacterized protein n=1 Tax=Actinocatenispora rupis TaxID=519421 RepID=A0A8J3J6D2_9ACTN|nr:hypothetical protein [Actinocatenispora rupis]GID10213.1 hypothetical protein Aru02nite_11020 [Actinocatenispora rupis]